MGIKRGIDVSDNQGIIDWSKVKTAGVEFAVLRSIRGSSKVDYQFANNVKGCQQNGIPFDVYKYSYALDEAKSRREFKEVCELLEQYGLNCTVWFDAEWKNMRALGKNAITRIIKTAEEVTSTYGYHFGIYCNLDWYKNVIDTSAFENEFWIARYPNSNTTTLKQMPSEKSKPNIRQKLFGWQYSSHGSVPGINGRVDMDIIYQESEAAPDGGKSEASLLCPYKEPIYTLYRGRLAMDKNFVKWLQWHLVRLGYLQPEFRNKRGELKNSVDGSFGLLTDEAVYEFQMAHPETYTTDKPDTKVGPLTRALIKQL